MTNILNDLEGFFSDGDWLVRFRDDLVALAKRDDQPKLSAIAKDFGAGFGGLLAASSATDPAEAQRYEGMALSCFRDGLQGWMGGIQAEVRAMDKSALKPQEKVFVEALADFATSVFRHLNVAENTDEDLQKACDALIKAAEEAQGQA